MQHKGKVGFGFRGQHTGRGEAVIVDQGGVVCAYPFHRVRRVGDDGIKGLVITKMWVSQRIAKLNIELVVVDVVQEHVHPGQVVSGVVKLLTKKTVFNNVGVKVFFGLQQQRARATGRVINLVDAGLLVHGELCNQFGHVLRGKELAARFTGIGGVVGDEKLVGIAKQVNVAAVKITKVEPSHAFEHGS